MKSQRTADAAYYTLLSLTISQAEIMESQTRYGVILAGGRATRMDHEDKGLLPLGGKPIVQWVAELATQQTSQLLLSVNHNAAKYEFLGLEQISDDQNVYGGPLVGIVSAMRYIRQQDPAGRELLACFPADVPWFPTDLVAGLVAKLRSTESEVVMAQEGEQLQPLFSVWSLAVLPRLEQAVKEGLYGPKLVMPQLRVCTVEFPRHKGHFHNINTPEDLVIAKQWLSETS